MTQVHDNELYERGRSVEIPNLLANARQQAEQRGLDALTIVDVDSHHSETSRWDAIVPHMADGPIRQWAESQIVRGTRSQAGGANITADQVGNQDVGGRIQRPGPRQLTSDVTDPDVARMLWAMDMMGIDYTVMFPTAMLMLGLHPQVEVEVELSRAYTNWFLKELVPQSPRMKSFVYLPFNDPAASLRAVEEFGDMPGVCGFVVTSVRHRPVHANDYAPVYRALEERGLPLAFHAAYDWNADGIAQMNKFISAHALGFTFCNMVHMTNLIMNGIPERFPDLKLIWVESGLAWVPFLMQRLDNEYMMRTSEAPLLRRLPSEYMRDMYYSVQPMEGVERPKMLEMTFEMINASERLLYSSDYPHWDFDLPSVIYDLPFLSHEDKVNILGGNAVKLLGLHPQGSSTSAGAGAGADAR